MAYKRVHDFDLRITDVTLAHLRLVAEGYTWNAYRGGRQACGVTCVMSGCAMLMYEDGSADRIGVGEMAFIPAGAAYRFYIPYGSADCSHCTLNFTISGDLSDWIAPNRANVVRPPRFEHYVKMFEESVQLWEGKQPGYRMLVLSILYQIVYDILSIGMQSRMDPLAYRQTLRAKQFMDENYCEKITLLQLANLCNMSVTHFRRQFKLVYKVSPIVYLMNLRLERARDLLLIHDYTLDNISDMMGFQNASYFIRFFKNHTGMTPQQFRKTY